MRGGMPDRIPYAPRLDLWFAANKARGTLPPAFRDFDQWEQVSRAQGWGFAKVAWNTRDTGRKPYRTAPWVFTSCPPSTGLSPVIRRCGKESE